MTRGEPDLVVARHELVQEIEQEVAHSWKYARANYKWHLVLVIAGLLASATASLSGLVFGAPTEVTSALALGPAILIGIAQTLRFQEKAAWWYTKRIRLDGLRRELLFECPETITRQFIADASRKLFDIEHSMEAAFPGTQQEGNQKPAGGPAPDTQGA